MQPPLQQANSLQPDTASRLLQSLLHNYNTPKSVMIERQLNQLKQYQSNRSSEAECQEESRILELMTKKTSQLKNLEELLVREFEEITETKEKYDRVRERLSQVRKEVKLMKEQYNIIRQQVIPKHLSSIKQSISQLTSQISVQLQKQLNHIYTSYQSQITSQAQKLHQNQLTIDSLSQQTQSSQQLLQSQSQQIYQLKKKLQQLESKANHESQTKILKSSQDNNHHNDLELSFGVDKDKVGKELLGVILHMKSNDSINVGNSESKSERFSKERNERLSEQRKRIKNDFGYNNQQNNNDLQQQQLSHHSQQQTQILIQPHNHSQTHPQFPTQLQPIQPTQKPHQLSRSNSYSSPRVALTQSLHRINTSTMLNNGQNDSSSAINKLDIFSELNQQNISQDELVWTNDKNGNDKEMNEDEVDMRKEKVTRSMKVAREDMKCGNHERKRAEQNKREIQYNKQQPQHTKKHPKLTTKQLNQQQTLRTNHQPTTFDPTSVTQLPQTLYQHQQSSTSQHQQSPATQKNRKSTTRYNYCKLYEQDQIKEIQNINLMCHNVFVAEKIDSMGKGGGKEILGNLDKSSGKYKLEKDYIGRKSPLRSGFARDADDLVRSISMVGLKNDLAGYRVSPIRQNRISPLKQSSLSPIKQSPYHRQPISYATPIKQQPYPSLTQLTHHTNTSPLLHSKSKKSLTIQIPKSPPQQKLQHLTQSSSKKNPYYRPQQHIHQMRYGNKEFQMEQHKVERVRYYDIPTVSTNDRAKPYSNSNHKQQPYQQGDRKRYIMQKIQLMKRKNHHQQPHQPQPYKQQSNPKPSYLDKYPQPNQNTKGYDFTQDKFQKQLSRRTSEKNYTDQGNNCSRTDLSRLTKPGLSRVTNMTGYVVNDYLKANVSRDGSRLSYNKAMERSSISKCGLVINVDNQEDEEERHNDIYQQLNSHNHERNGYDHQPSSFNQPYTKKETSSSMIDAQNHIPTLHQPRLPNKSPLKKSNPDQPYFPGSSPLKPSNKHNNSLYLQSKQPNSKDHNRSLQQQRQNTRPIYPSDYHYQKQEKYTEENLYRHPYVEKDNGTINTKTYKKRQDLMQNIGTRRF